MTQKKLAIRAAIASVIAVGFIGASQSALAAKGDMEKCTGVVKAGKNDCGTATHSCAGQSKADNEKGAWISVPKGTCEKVTGGSVVGDMAKAEEKKK